MEVPAMAINGVAPTLSPVFVVFLVVAIAGAFMLVAALLLRNVLLVTRKKLNPVNAADWQHAGNPGFSTRPAGAKPFFETTYARAAVALLATGTIGMVVMGLWALFSA